MFSIRHHRLLLIIVAIALLVYVDPVVSGTIERLADYGYKAENHTVQTHDGYILTLFRIPPRARTPNVTTKSVVYFQHGFLSSSDCWILNGRDNAVALLLADQGYDVWFGNSRGNTYSRRHMTMSPESNDFWKFSWHEMGLYDLPASIDYVLKVSGQPAVHYVGHSQGTTALMVMLSELPEYGDKVKTSHMLAPVAFLRHMKSFIRLLSPMWQVIESLLGARELLPNAPNVKLAATTIWTMVCLISSTLEPLCTYALDRIMHYSGWDSKHLNTSLWSDIIETQPAGSSSWQLIHFLQLNSEFRQFDHGSSRNQELYQQPIPPEYRLERIRRPDSMHLYYSDNDDVVDPEDVQILAEKLGSKPHLHHIEFPDWNHIDFLWANEVKREIANPIMKVIKIYDEEGN